MLALLVVALFAFFFFGFILLCIGGFLWYSKSPQTPISGSPTKRPNKKVPRKEPKKDYPGSII